MPLDCWAGGSVSAQANPQLSEYHTEIILLTNVNTGLPYFK